MKASVLLSLCSALAFLAPLTPCFAAEHPAGDITFYNASNKTITVTAETSSLGKFNLNTKEHKTVSYSSLASICASTPTHCTAEFFTNNQPSGYATLNTVTGQVIKINLHMKIQTSEDHEVLRAVVLQ